MKSSSSSSHTHLVSKTRKHIHKTFSKINKHLSRFKVLVERMLTKAKEEQAKYEAENKKNYDGASETLKKVIEKSNSINKRLIAMSAHLETMNSTAQKHYAQLLEDTSYLERLRVIKPKFLKTLRELVASIVNVKNMVSSNVISGGDKDVMYSYLSKIHFHSTNITGNVASAFIAHYKKYKHLIVNENKSYKLELMKLAAFEKKYGAVKVDMKDHMAEYNRIMELVSKLRSSYETSKKDRADFDEMVARIVSLMKNRKC
jgi:vacuolar-type H+-ATPase subunit E/Vma4